MKNKKNEILIIQNALEAEEIKNSKKYKMESLDEILLNDQKITNTSDFKFFKYLDKYIDNGFNIVLSDQKANDLSIKTCPLCNSKLTYLEKK